MTKFLYLSDSHVGTTPIGFQQQPAYSEHVEEMVSALDEWIIRRGDIEFIIHGGDMVNDAALSNIQRAAKVFDLSVPVYLCLGNHDLDTPEALDHWMTHAPGFFIGGDPNFIIHHGDLHIAIMPNQWEERPYYWQQEQRPHFTPNQHAWIDHVASGKHGHEIQMLVTHNPSYSISTAQTGFSEPFHAPDASFTSSMERIASLFSNIRCVAGAHSHINSCTEVNDVHFITSSSFVEAPFDFKLFEIDQHGVRMETCSLASSVSFNWSYNFDKTYVQGRLCDREFKNGRNDGNENSSLQHS